MKVLMVCLGNICRSPLAEGLLQKKVDELKLPVQVDSAGTSNYHIGEQADKRMRATSQSFGLAIEHLRARQFKTADFDQFDLIYTMDESNYENILKLARSEEDRSKVKMILNELYPGENRNVPDPYFGGEDGFIAVYKLLDETTDKVIEKLQQQLA